jgi:hypothetical protein
MSLQNISFTLRDKVTIRMSLRYSNVEVPVLNYASQNESMSGKANIIPRIIISVIGGDKWAASLPGRFSSVERVASFH